MDKKKSIYLLNLLNFLILLSGCIFIAYSVVFKISFRVINTNVSGSILGLLVVYFSVRHFKKIYELKNELKKSDSNFSWSNFKNKREFYN